MLVLTVVDEDGYDVPIFVGNNRDSLEEAYEEWRKEQYGNDHWTTSFEISHATWVD